MRKQIVIIINIYVFMKKMKKPKQLRLKTLK
jgi:hypothetical protein